MLVFQIQNDALQIDMFDRDRSSQLALARASRFFSSGWRSSCMVCKLSPYVPLKNATGKFRWVISYCSYLHVAPAR